MACDNLAAVRVFEPTFLPEPQQESFALVSCLHAQIKKSPFRWNATHVDGHQDTKKGGQSLTRLEQLNVAMDNLAKGFWNHLLEEAHHPMVPPSITVLDEGWSIWKGDNKLASPNKKTLYPHLRDEEALEFWCTPHQLQPQPRLVPEAITNINWEACAAAMKALGLSR